MKSPPVTVERIKLSNYPQLKLIAWHMPDVEELSPEQAAGLYDRNWRHIDQASLTDAERDLINRLNVRYGVGRAPV